MIALKFWTTSLLMLIGCDRKDVPDDFQFSAESIAIQASDGGEYAISIKPSEIKDQFVLTVTRASLSHQRIFTKADIRPLFKAIIDQKVFSMKNDYQDMQVLDGQTTIVTLVAHGKHKRIRMRNTVPAQMTVIFTLINKLSSAH